MKNKCNNSSKIVGLILVNKKDMIFDKNGRFVRMKRKYGKYKREIHRYI